MTTETEYACIYKLLEAEAGLSEDEVDKYFAITRKNGEFILKLRGGAWLETTTYQAMQNLLKKRGGSYLAKPQATYTIPEAKLDNRPDSLKYDKSQPPTLTVEEGYSLAASGEGLGELYPVLKDAHGNVIDGFHRLGEKPDWHTETRPQIDTPVKLQLAMLAANFNRRNMAPEEITQRITFLVKAGLKPEEIAKITGISERTIHKYTPQDLKDAKKIAAGQSPKQLQRDDSAALLQQTVTTQDTEEHDLLVEALDTAKFPCCPRCQQQPASINQALPWVTDANGHSWNLKTGEVAMLQYETCNSCHTSVDKSRLKDGVCDVCRERKAQITVPEPPLAPETEPPTHEEAKPSKPIDHESVGVSCPVCGVGMSRDKYERAKKKLGTKYPDLFSFSEEKA